MSLCSGAGPEEEVAVVVSRSSQTMQAKQDAMVNSKQTAVATVEWGGARREAWMT